MNWKQLRYGEALLWILFLLISFVSLADDGPDNGPTIAGLFLLAAIGLRATRVASPTDA